MASTTSAAANMLLSGSMSSADHGLLNPNFLARAILPPCSSNIATISASAPFPSVTLDLTHSPNPLQIQRQHHHQQQQQHSTLTALPQIFGQPLYNQSRFSGLQLSQDSNSSERGIPFSMPMPQSQGQQTSLAETVSAATAAITNDPHFTAAIAAAISSIINSNNNVNSSTPDTKTKTTPPQNQQQ
uniref:WRKY transcription factor n=1 Tax=Sedum alfredii TaxID=439688 RepID=A0A650AVH7_9MAGN|nr:WRKY transcription factor [Sedum alfredii]